MTGVSVSIFRSGPSDCTNNGITSPENSEGKTFVIFDPAIRMGNYDLEESRNNPNIVCLKIVTRDLSCGLYMHVEEIDKPAGWSMAGGNYVCTSDSRFADISPYPLSVHDRIEG